MSEEILNEIIEETTEELLPQKVNDFCVISKEVYVVTDINGKEHKFHLIETNSAWGANPYPDYAVVPDDMITAIMETRGFCNIVLNDDGTEVVEFTTREIPDFPESEHVPSQLDLIEAQITYTALMTDTLL